MDCTGDDGDDFRWDFLGVINSGGSLLPDGSSGCRRGSSSSGCRLGFLQEQGPDAIEESPDDGGDADGAQHPIECGAAWAFRQGQEVER